jgi:hypothetical protein
MASADPVLLLIVVLADLLAVSCLLVLVNTANDKRMFCQELGFCWRLSTDVMRIERFQRSFSQPR